MSYLSGLISMWLGFSALAFFEGLERTCERIYRYLVDTGRIQPRSPSAQWRHTTTVINAANTFSRMSNQRPRVNFRDNNTYTNYVKPLSAWKASAPVRPMYVTPNAVPSYTNYLPEVRYIKPVKPSGRQSTSRSK